MTTTTQQMRAWRGPALLSYGFRPFFLGAALWAALAMALWIPFLLGAMAPPTRFDPVSWHAHEFLFGYLGAVLAGFLLTAVPNWTGRLPVVGWPLGALVLLWLAGRLAIALSTHLPPWLAALADLALPLALIGFLAREIVSGKNWRNLIVLALLVAFTLANAAFHAQAEGFPAGDSGFRAGLGTATLMIAVIGGRIIPSFTRNWLVQRGINRLPAPPMRPFDRAALLILLAALALWVFLPESRLTAAALIGGGLVHAARLARWRCGRTLTEPLLWILHVAYGFIPLGALALGLSLIAPDLLDRAAAQHVWMAGAIGLMTLAVMTRATLGHTGQALTASRGAVAIYLCLIGATLVRLLAGLAPESAELLYMVSGGLWIAAYGGFAALYAPSLLRLKKYENI